MTRERRPLRDADGDEADEEADAAAVTAAADEATDAAAVDDAATRRRRHRPEGPPSDRSSVRPSVDGWLKKLKGKKDPPSPLSCELLSAAYLI